jgi:hypothetical protein
MGLSRNLLIRNRRDSEYTHPLELRYSDGNGSGAPRVDDIPRETAPRQPTRVDVIALAKTDGSPMIAHRATVAVARARLPGRR